MLAGLQSPFSLTSALKFGVIFVVLHTAGQLAQRAEARRFLRGEHGGRLRVAASATAAAAYLAVTGTLPVREAGIGAILASLMSAMVNVPIVARVAPDTP